MLRREDPEPEPTDREPNASAGGAGAPPDPAAPNRAPDLTREYATNEVTIQWYAGRCIHSGNCVRALQAVFDPRRRPWVDPTAASTADIVSAVVRCPSGALHFTRHDGAGNEQPDEQVTITLMPDGPLYVRGDLEIRTVDGTPIRRDVRAALCRCGRAHAMPFCDNRCRTTGWRESDKNDRL